MVKNDQINTFDVQVENLKKISAGEQLSLLQEKLATCTVTYYQKIAFINSLSQPMKQFTENIFSPPNFSLKVI